MGKRNKIQLKNNTDESNQANIGSSTKIEKTNTQQIAFLNKQKVNENSKFKKKLKSTLKKMTLDNELLIDSIDAIKSSLKQNKKLGKEKEIFDYNYENIYLYIFLKNKNEDEEENTSNTGNNSQDSNEKLKELNSKLIKLPISAINEVNNHRLCLIDDNLLNEKQSNKAINEEGSETLEEKILNKLSLDEEEEQNIEVMSSDEFLSKLKTEKNIFSQYNNFLVSETLRTKITQALKSKKQEFNSSSIFYYNKSKYGKKIFLYLKKLITVLLTSTILKINSKYNLGMLKIGNSGLSTKTLYKNTKIILMKVVSLLLCKSEKHANVKCVVLKTQNSLPFEIHGQMTTKELNYFESK